MSSGGSAGDGAKHSFQVLHNGQEVQISLGAIDLTNLNPGNSLTVRLVDSAGTQIASYTSGPGVMFYLVPTIIFDATNYSRYELQFIINNAGIGIWVSLSDFDISQDQVTPTEVCGEVDYRFGFNGMEKDNQISGVGNSMTAEFWQYDARLGRRWNTDPVVKEWESPYATFHNSPIFYSDAKGDDPEPKKKERSVRKYERKFNRLAKKHSDWTNDQLHDEMERRHNGKRWMWVQAETGSNVSGDGQDHSRYYHAGDLFQDAHPEHARTPPPALLNQLLQ